MNRNRTILRQWLGAVLGAVIIAAAVPATAWGQTPVQQGVRAGSNIATVNGTEVTAGQVVSAGRETTVTIITAAAPAGKVAKVTVTKKEDFLASSATITGDNTVNKNGTTTLTATVTPTYANTVVWTVTPGTGSAEFVTGETTTAATVTSVVNPETGQATATLKGLEAGTVTVDVKATGDATATLNETAKTVTVLNVPATVTTAPTVTSGDIMQNTSTFLVTTGSASGGTMKYKVTTDINVTTGTAMVTLKGLVLGTTTVSVKATGEASTELANRPVTVYTAPTKASNWSYDKNAHNLISAAGTVLNGTMYYKVDYTPNIGDPSSTEWSTDLPTATNAGTYRIYCKSETDLGYTGCVEETELGTVTVNRVNWTGSVTVEMGSKCHNYDLGGGQSYDTYWWRGTYNRSGAHSDGTITKWEYCNWLFQQGVWSGYNNANNTGNPSPWIEEAPRWRVTIGADNNHNQTQFEHTWTGS